MQRGALVEVARPEHGVLHDEGTIRFCSSAMNVLSRTTSSTRRL